MPRWAMAFDPDLCVALFWVDGKFNFGVYDIDTDRWQWA